MRQYDNPELQDILIKIQQVIDNIESWRIEKTKQASPYIQDFSHRCDRFHVHVSGARYGYEIAITYFNDKDPDGHSSTWLITDNHEDNKLEDNLEFLTTNDIVTLKKIGHANVIAEFVNTGLAQQVYEKLREIYPEPAGSSDNEILNKINRGLDQILKNLN